MFSNSNNFGILSFVHVVHNPIIIKLLSRKPLSPLEYYINNCSEFNSFPLYGVCSEEGYSMNTYKCYSHLILLWVLLHLLLTLFSVKQNQTVPLSEVFPVKQTNIVYIVHQVFLSLLDNCINHTVSNTFLWIVCNDQPYRYIKTC